MKCAVAIASLCATLAIAGPVIKRTLVTDWVYDTVTITVTGSAVEAEATSEGRFFPDGGHWSGWSGWSSEIVSTSTVVSTNTPAPTPAPTPSPAPAPSSVAPAPAPAASPDLSDYATSALLQHNLHRRNHSSSDLSWDNDLANIAQQIAETCVYGHSTSVGGGGYGQNIGAGAPDSDLPKMITNDMYNGEINWYPGYGNEPDMTDFEHWGHFSQIVWADTTSLGCYTAYCPNGLANTGAHVSPYFTVCNYKPAGNFGGEYGKNVLAPKGNTAVVIS